MNAERLYERVSEVAALVVADSRWRACSDDLGVSVMGMLLYGYALAIGRFVMLLDLSDINNVVARVVSDHTGSAEEWTKGMVQAAAAAAFDEQVHPGHFELIGVGHQYMTSAPGTKAIVENIFANIHAFASQQSS
jgi:hypothetical protein